MGPNGSGKSTLANVIMGQPNLEVTEGQIIFQGQDITEADPDERARMGLFMAFQYPVSIPGVTITKYLRMVMNAHREARGEAEVSLKDFRKTVEAGDGAHQRPARVLLPLPQRGLLGRREEAPGDPPARAAAAARSRSSTRPTPGSTSTRSTSSPTASTPSPRETDMGVLIITHYQRILHLVQPDRVSIMFEGRIVKEGGPELVEQLEREGYGWVRDEVAAAA